MRQAPGAAVALLGFLAATSCAHAPATRAAPATGLTAIERWTAALYPNQAAPIPGLYTWWIDPPTREGLSTFSVSAASMPKAATPLNAGRRSSLMTDRVAYVLAACAAHRFAPLILRRSQDPKAIEAADQLEAAGKDLPWERGAKIPRTTLTHFVEAHGKAEATFERLRGDASKQAPSAEEIAAGLLLTADNATASIADRARPDSHDIPPAYRDFADVPLTLAPLYALAAGVAPKVVEQTTQTCFGALGEAQHHPEMLVVFHPMAPKPRKR